MHSEPVVAGVIGRKRFVYDIWGDLVNVASRMESQGFDDIQVSEDTRRLFGDRFVGSEHGRVNVRGKGEMTTYVLKGLA